RLPGGAGEFLARGDPVVELPGGEEPKQRVTTQLLTGHQDAPADDRLRVASCIRAASQSPKSSSWMRCRVAPSRSAGWHSSITTSANPRGVATGPTSWPTAAAPSAA